MAAELEIRLRSARQDDSSSIRRLIRQAQINPVGLNWRRFLVAVDGMDQVVACGQLKPHRTGLTELASITVDGQFRGQGIDHKIVDRLVATGPRPLYLTCRSGLGPFYKPWGFREMTMDEMPAYYRRFVRLMSAVVGMFRDGERLLVMVLK